MSKANLALTKIKNWQILVKRKLGGVMKELKIIITTVLLTLSMICLIAAIAGKVTSYFDPQAIPVFGNLAMLFCFVAMLLNSKFLYSKVDFFSDSSVQAHSWIDTHSTKCFILGCSAASLSIVLIFALLFKPQNQYLTMIFSLLIMLCLFLSGLMFPAIEKKFGPI